MTFAAAVVYCIMVDYEKTSKHYPLIEAAADDKIIYVRICMHTYERIMAAMKNILFYVRIGVKLCFSLVLLQLLYVSFCLTGDMTTPLYAVPEMLEYCAASASVIFAGAYILEYCLGQQS